METHLDEINTGERDDHVPGQDYAGSQEPVEEVDERDLPGRRDSGTSAPVHVRHHVSRTAKEYGGHGPCTSTVMLGCSAVTDSALALNEWARS